MKLDRVPEDYRKPLQELMRAEDAGDKVSVASKAKEHDVNYQTLNKYYKKARDVRLGYHLTHQVEESTTPQTKATLTFLQEDYAKFTKESLEQKKQAQELLKESLILSSRLMKSVPDFETLQGSLRIHSEAGDADAKAMIGLLSQILKALNASSFKNLKDLVNTISDLDKSIAQSLYLPYGDHSQILRDKKTQEEIKLTQEKIKSLAKAGGTRDVADYFMDDDIEV